ncbi:MAG: 3-dehydroquinate synthase [Nitrospirota bacterium]|nr:3-dehydroquinate synthase [Nitrospirota bacterium]
MTGTLGQERSSLSIAGVAEQMIPVILGERSYDIVLHPGLLATVGARLSAFTTSPKIGIVTDRHVASRYLQGTLRSLCKAGFDPTPIILPPGERTKTLGTVAKILDILAKHKFERQSLLLALGGGVIGDVTGFAAAIYQRGIPFVQVPTTLVAQVDSSVGGKTGVDHRLGKNLIGAFYQPRVVLIDPLTLRTLPRREWIAGLAEVIKYGIIADEEFFAFLEQEIPALLKLEEEPVMHAIQRSCEIKAQVVAADERESDRRRMLNYGHTIGHALESLAGYRGLIHGEAVGIGLVQEADLACHMSLCRRDVVERIRSLVQRAGLSEQLPRVSCASLWSTMQHDKKVVGGRVIGVWPVRIGEVVIRPLEQPDYAAWFQSKHGRGSRPSSGRQPGKHPVRRKARAQR